MDNNFILSVSAMVIALASLVAIIWQGIITRKHNRLSVKPIPNILLSNYENRIAVTLENKGTGPLIIKTFKVYIGKTSKSNIIDWMPKLSAGVYWADYLRNFENTAFQASEAQTLLEFKLDIDNPKEVQERDNIRKALADVSLEFDYTDIYNTNMHFPLNSFSSTFGKYKTK